MSPFLPRAGFTLIELLIAIGIILLVTGGGMAAYIRFNDRQTVLSAARDVQAFIRAAQIKARVKETPANCALTAFEVEGQLGAGATFNMFANCGPTFTRATPAIDTYTLPASVSLAANERMRFFSLYGDTAFVNADGTVRLSGSGVCYEFRVEPGGVMTEVEEVTC